MQREKEGYDISERADNYLNNPETRARALTGSGGLRRRGEIFGDGSAPDVQMTGDFAQRLVLGPVQAMNFVDLFRCQHGSEFGYTDRPARMP